MSFPDMKTLVPARKHGRAEVIHRTVTPLESMQSMFSGNGGYYCPEGTYAVLHVGDTLEMSDTRHERITNFEIVRQARGNVLIAGLGLGMILHPILAKPEVTHVTVVERERDVIRLIAPTLPLKRRDNGVSRWTIEHGDIDTWRPADDTRYNTIYFDIWPTVSLDNYPQMKALVRAFRKYRAPGAWVRCWAVDEVRSQAREEARYAR